jgi:hypothetical protein
MARETVLSRIGANVKLSQLPIMSASGFVRPPEVRSSMAGAAFWTFLVVKARLACCWAGETAEGAIVALLLGGYLSVSVRTLLRQREEDKKHDPFAGIIQIKFLPYNLSRSGAVGTFSRRRCPTTPRLAPAHAFR